MLHERPGKWSWLGFKILGAGFGGDRSDLKVTSKSKWVRETDYNIVFVYVWGDIFYIWDNVMVMMMMGVMMMTMMM